MTAWILVTLAITAGLTGVIAQLLARHVTAMTALAVTAVCLAVAFGQWHQTWAVELFAAYTVGFLLLAASRAVRRKLPPYALNRSSDETEEEPCESDPTRCR